jgi:hypothetical protein
MNRHPLECGCQRLQVIEASDHDRKVRMHGWERRRPGCHARDLPPDEVGVSEWIGNTGNEETGEPGRLMSTELEEGYNCILAPAAAVDI